MAVKTAKKVAVKKVSAKKLAVKTSKRVPAGLTVEAPEIAEFKMQKAMIAKLETYYDLRSELSGLQKALANVEWTGKPSDVNAAIANLKIVKKALQDIAGSITTTKPQRTARGGVQKQILEFLQAHPGSTASEIAKALGKSTLANTLGDMTKKGILKKSEDKKYSAA